MPAVVLLERKKKFNQPETWSCPPHAEKGLGSRSRKKLEKDACALRYLPGPQERLPLYTLVSFYPA